MGSRGSGPLGSGPVQSPSRRSRAGTDSSLRASYLSERAVVANPVATHVTRCADRLDSGAGKRHAGDVDESQQWLEFGRLLTEQRELRGLRRRDAARRAKVSETLWRDLETGRKEAIGAI